MHWYTDVVFKKYAVFSGRAARPEYWWFVLADLIVAFLLSLVVGIVIGAAGGSSGVAQGVSFLYNLAVLLPTIGVGIRRLHDTNRSGWWLLLNFIPIIGWIWIIVLWATDSDPGPNRYGPNRQHPALGCDPQTGAPLGQPAARFDPQTGQPLTPQNDPPV